MKISNNPVGRLFDILRLLQKKAGGAKNEVLSVVLGKVFDINSNNPSDVLRIQLELLNLIKDSKKEIEKLPASSHELHLRAVRRIESAFAVHHLHSPWGSFSEYLDPATMTGLEHTANNLTYSGEQTVPEDDLDNLKNQVEELLNLIIKMDINSKLRAFLIEQLEKIHAAVLYYRINGAKGLKDALERITGALIIFSGEYKGENIPEEIKPKFNLTMELLIKIVAFANDLKGLTGIDPLLLPRLP